MLCNWWISITAEDKNVFLVGFQFHFKLRSRLKCFQKKREGNLCWRWEAYDDGDAAYLVVVFSSCRRARPLITIAVLYCYFEIVYDRPFTFPRVRTRLETSFLACLRVCKTVCSFLWGCIRISSNTFVKKSSSTASTTNDGVSSLIKFNSKYPKQEKKGGRCLIRITIRWF